MRHFDNFVDARSGVCRAERENEESEVNVRSRETEAAVGLYGASEVVESEQVVRGGSRGQGGSQKSEGRQGIGNGAT
jgi:hypothetical protein